MRTMLFAALAVLTMSAGSGCALFDHFCGHHCGHGKAYDNCTDCDSCGGEGCSYCGPNCGACGCCGDNCACPPGGCGPHGCKHCQILPHCHQNRAAVANQFAGPAGPPAAQVTYPYYTTRGPRDFLAKNPPSIGPQ